MYYIAKIKGEVERMRCMVYANWTDLDSGNLGFHSAEDDVE